MSRIRKAAALISVAALIGTGGLGAAQAATYDGSSAADRPTQRHGGGPLPSAQLTAIAEQLGITSEQLKAAMQAAKPAKPAAGTAASRGDGMVTALAAALGADAATVKEILDANRPAKPSSTQRRSGKPPAKPANTKLVAALASGLSIDTATVKAAFAKIEAARKADHAAREAAMYAAVAAQLNVSADAVKTAFEANRPAKPRR